MLNGSIRLFQKLKVRLSSGKQCREFSLQRSREGKLRLLGRAALTGRVSKSLPDC
jgi:hypothetical protein